jgi:hypothetical protein
MYYGLASEVVVSPNLLFMENDVYDFKLDYEMTVIGYYSNKKYNSKYDLNALSMSVLSHGYEIDNVLSNYKFYAIAIRSRSTLLQSTTKNLRNIGKNSSRVFYDCDFVSNTPSLCRAAEDDMTMFVVVRFVNYAILDSGQYSQKKKIVSRNVMAEIKMQQGSWDIIREYELGYDTERDDDLYMGLEDIRLHRNSLNNTITYNANRVHCSDSCDVEHGTI